ncbi:MAG TPA: PAS domain S-box protein [Gemmatimonadales bacterium]|nr:PAS domain S-box protein [Gemmatimonadales bacterium]
MEGHIVSRPARLPRHLAIPVGISVLLVIVVGGFATAAYWEVRRVTVAAAEQHLKQVTTPLEAVLRPQRLDEVSRVAAQPEVEAYLRRGKAAPRAVADALTLLTRRDSLSTAVELWNLAGQRVLLVGRPLPRLDTTAAQALGASVTRAGAVGPLRALDSSLCFPVIAAVGPKTSPLGYVVHWRRIVSTPEPTRRLSELIGADAVLLLGNRSGDLWTDLSVPTPVASPPVRVGGDTGVLEYTRPGRGTYFATATPIGGTPWALVVAVPQDRVLAPAQAFLHRIGGVALFFIGAGVMGAMVLNRRIAVPERRNAETAIQEQAHLLDFAHVLVRDQDGTIRLWNTGAEQLYGWTKAEAVGQISHELLHTVFPEPLEHINAALERTGHWQGLLKHRPRDGRQITVASHWVLHRAASGTTSVLEVNNDITEQRRVEDLFRSVVAASPVGMIMVERTGERRIVLVNRQIESMFGYNAGELLGKSVDLLLPAQRGDHEQYRGDFFSPPEAGGMAAGRALYGIHKDGHRIPVEIGINTIERGTGTFVVASVLDITERKRGEDELRRSNEELERFALVASHDLQEPLRMVGSYVQLLGDRYQGKLDADADTFIAYARDAALQMQHLVADLLAFSRVDPRGGARVATDAQAVLDRALASLKLSIEDAGAVVTTDALPTLPADPGQLEHVFINLIGNALKFCGAQRPEVHVSAARQDDGWLFSVRDNGIGIDPQYFDRIFVMLQRLHARDVYPGTGIGLAITKRIVEGHGGRIWVDSQPGRGSTFFFTIPGRP